jgi:hypothetical protein
MSTLRLFAALLIWAWAARAQQRISPEMNKAIEEFRVQSRALGLRGDSPVKAAGNGGRNIRWHGRLFENFRNNLLDAIPHEVVQRGGSKGMLRRNQFGGNLSGPFVIPRLYDGTDATFFTFTFEAVRERVGRAFLRTIPTLAERTGDWSSVVDAAGNLLPVYDPAATAANAAFDPARPVGRDNLQYNRMPFPDNRIPAGRLDPVAREAVQHYPAPNTDAGPFFRNNYYVFAPERNSANGVIFRVDHNFPGRHRAGFGLNISSGLDGSAALFPTIANPASAARDRDSRRGAFEHVFTRSPRSVNTVTFSASSDRLHFVPELGADGRPFPNYRFQPYLSMGRSYPTYRNTRNTFQFEDGFSMQRRSHRLRLSGQLTHEQVHIFSPQYPEGSFRFSAGLTSLPGVVNTGHAFASFLLGQAEYAEKSVVTSPSYFRKDRYRVAIADQWELRKGLTFQASLGLEISSPRVEKHDRQSTISFSEINPVNQRPGALVVANHNGQPREFQPVLVKAEPSASLAWNPLGDTKTVVRAGYGRSYQPIPLYSLQWGTQAFNGTPTWVSLNPQLSPAATLSAGLPENDRQFPDLRPESANNTVADLIEPDGRQPTFQSASLSFERELPGAFLVTAGVSRSEGRNLLLGNTSANPNAIPLSALTFRDHLNEELFNRSLRPFPHYQRFDVYSCWPEGRFQRHAAQLRVEKRTSTGLTLSASYEFSKQMDDYSGPYGVQDYYNRRNEWSLTSSNNPQRLTMTFNYELPFGANRLFFPVADWRRHLAGGWSVSGVTTLASGEPLALRPMFNNTGGVADSLTVNAQPGVNPHVPNPSPELWFNPAAFSQPADFTTGNASRTHPTLRGPRNQNHDLALNKRFAVTPEKSVEFSMLGLNFINRANWTDPDVLIGPPHAPNVNAGKIIGSRGSRVIQLGMRFSF